MNVTVKNTMTDNSHVMHAHMDEDGIYSDIYPRRIQVKMCGPGTIHEILVRERMEGEPDSPYWGWLGKGKERPTFVWANYVNLCVCFQGEAGLVAAENAGRGRAVNLIIDRGKCD